MPASTELIDFKGRPAVRLGLSSGASTVVALHGAHVLSWMPTQGVERLYLSDKSEFVAGKAIRGGIPVIFPQFSDHGPLPRHGFARTRDWELVSHRSGTGDGGDFACAVFRLEADAHTHAIWSHDFAIELTAMLSEGRLDVELEVENQGDSPLDFTAALHTYVRVQEVEMTAVEGLTGKRYRDQTQGGEVKEERSDAVMVTDELDRIYLNVANPVLVRARGGALAIQADGLPDVVVWNPWEAKCAALADMPKDGFRRMLCVEAAAVARPIIVAPGEFWVGRQTLVAL